MEIAARDLLCDNSIKFDDFDNYFEILLIG